MNKEFWKATAKRSIRTICQTAVGMIPAAAMISDVDWKAVVGTALLAGVVSVLTSIATGLPEVEGRG